MLASLFHFTPSGCGERLWLMPFVERRLILKLVINRMLRAIQMMKQSSR